MGRVDERVWMRVAGEEVMVTHVGSGWAGPARPPRSRPGRQRTPDEHDPPGASRVRRVRRSASHGRAARRRPGFLAIGQGAAQRLGADAAAGTPRARATLAEATTLAKLHGNLVDRALGTVALAGRFDDGDLAAILDHQRHQPRPTHPRRAGEPPASCPGTVAPAGRSSA